MAFSILWSGCVTAISGRKHRLTQAESYYQHPVDLAVAAIVDTMNITSGIVHFEQQVGGAEAACSRRLLCRGHARLPKLLQDPRFPSGFIDHWLPVCHACCQSGIQAAITILQLVLPFS